MLLAPNLPNYTKTENLNNICTDLYLSCTTFFSVKATRECRKDEDRLTRYSRGSERRIKKLKKEEKENEEKYNVNVIEKKR